MGMQWIIFVTVTALLWIRAPCDRWYYNDRYSADGIWYYPDDEVNGLYDFDLGYVDNPLEGSKPIIKGCDMVLRQLTCSNATIVIQLLRSLTSLSSENLYNTTQSLTITDCSGFTHFEEGTFDTLVRLTYLKVQHTALNHLPDVSGTALEIMHLAGNEITMDTATYRGWKFPSTTTHVVLANNSIYWIPDGFISGSHLRMMSLSHNAIRAIQSSMFGDISDLVYLGLDGNDIDYLPNNAFPATSTLLHLNISDNNLKYIMPGTFNHISNLKILELHRNALENIKPGALHGLNKLVGLDLHLNRLHHLNSGALKNLPNLKLLYLNSQKDKMRTIAYDAWQNIGQNLREITLGDNKLQAFPHPVFEEGYYPKLKKIHIDRNEISNTTEYSLDAFLFDKEHFHALKLKTFKPFSTCPYLEELNFDYNRITHITRTDFCELRYLTHLRFYRNSMLVENIDDDALACLPRLAYIDLFYNKLQYIPRCFSEQRLVPSLRQIHIGGNRITFVEEGQVSNIGTLSQLGFYNNPIITVTNRAFPTNLKWLSLLSDGDFRFLHEEPFRYLPRLERLWIAGNKVDYLPLNAFQNCRRLLTLNAGNNDIPELRKQHVEGLTKLKYLYFHYNKIAWIEDGTFSDMKDNLVHLTLKDNLLSAVPLGGSFSNKRIAGTLDFSNNRITHIPDDAFKNLNCPNILLANNPIFTMGSNTFSGINVDDSTITANLRHLEELSPFAIHNTHVEIISIRYTKIRVLRTNTFNHVSAVTLELQDNPIVAIEDHAFVDVTFVDLRLGSNLITSLAGPIFGGRSRVEEIYIRNNRVNYISRDAFDNVMIAQLFLSGNRIKKIPTAIQKQTALVEIWLDWNAITEVRAGAFRGMVTLTTINLSKNNIGWIEMGAFDDLANLKLLYLQENTIRTLPTMMFDGCLKLKKLLLSDNDISHIHQMSLPLLETLDLKNNPLRSIAYLAFKPTTKLNRLSLDDCPLECTCQLIETIDVRRLNISGTCIANDDAKGVELSLDKVRANYYRFVNPAKFQCSGENVTGLVISPTELTVQWEHPSVSHFDKYLANPAPDVTGDIEYTVRCHSRTVPDVTTPFSSVINANGSNTPSVTLTAADGIQAGNTYECSVKATYQGSISARSPATVLLTPRVPVTPPPPGPSDLDLEITYHDFSANHSDFDNADFIIYVNVTYVDSLFGAWLEGDVAPGGSGPNALASWFKHDPPDNYEFRETIFLEKIGASVYRYWSNTFFPLEGRGFESENQRDCYLDFHNFGFTSAIRTNIVFGGSEVITVAGGEGLWLYIDKVGVLDATSAGLDPPACYVVDLSPIASSGGNVTVQTGKLINGACVNLASSGEVPLELEVGSTYHFDLFHAETVTCTSEFLLVFENVNVQRNIRPMDITVAVSEDLGIEHVVTAVPLADAFSAGPYNVTLYAGNEQHRFTVKEVTGLQPNVTEPSPSYTNITDVEGNVFQFVECPDNDTTGSNTPLPYNTTAESFTITTAGMYIVLAGSLDFETVTENVLYFTVVDLTLGYTGNVAVRVVVTDTNDNCPVVAIAEAFMPNPVLRQGPILTLNGSDMDTGNNADLRYIVTQLDIDPMSDYDANTDDLSNFHIATTIFTIDIVAIDNGTVPRGSKAAKFNITLSNSCVLDARLGVIPISFVINDTTGELTMRIPGYYMSKYDCDELVGLSTGWVLDSSFSASSSINTLLAGPHRARLNKAADFKYNFYGAWVAGTPDPNQNVQVDMGQPYRFKKVHIQGRDDADEWVTSFIIWYDVDNGTWVKYNHSDGTQVFPGSTDRSTVVVQALDPVIEARRIRVNPKTWHGGNISMRLEFSGCAQAKYQYYGISCLRCETSYYCLGDGERHTCGRCHGNTSTCDRDPTEHSFGLATECASCPQGWICKDGYASTCPPFHYALCTNVSCLDQCAPCEPGYACYQGQRTICQPGYYSDGTLTSCRPCRPGTYQDQWGQATCLPCDPGYHNTFGQTLCSPCPPLLVTSDGKTCTPCRDASQCPCLDASTCFRQNLCINTGAGGHICLPCPNGYIGDGKTCTDINECTEYDPCFQSRCINTDPGYQCLECPAGYTGTYEDAYSWVLHRRVFLYQNLERSNFSMQTCDDDDECAMDNGGCSPERLCVNTMGSFTCDCRPGYLEINGTCVWHDMAASGQHDCSPHADASFLGPMRYMCTCKPGYAGNGMHCGLDTDMDGFPDTALPYEDWGCAKDNCREIPNSMQVDSDGDTIGNSCDLDDDNDNLLDEEDNCPMVHNQDQRDRDGDGVGDACDNCPDVFNAGQQDSDGDGKGNVCDSDMDDDDVPNSSDNCPKVWNKWQSDSDGDGVGNACDNCPDVYNSLQVDGDGNWAGNACQAPWIFSTDTDGDGSFNFEDNCKEHINGDQANKDQDTIGDACDGDIDKDGIKNSDDNCPYFFNTGQSDDDGDGVGNVCETDSDGDGVDDRNDTCPNHSGISATVFSEYIVTDLNADWGEPASSYVVHVNEIRQTVATPMPSVLVARRKYGDMEYQGTWYVSNTSAVDYFGCVFGYRSNREFYAVLWRRTNQNFKDLEGEQNWPGGIRGLQIKLVDLDNGPSHESARALWRSTIVADYTVPLWHDPGMIPWEPRTAYRWYLTFKPSLGLINLKVYQGTSLLVDSGPVYHMFLTGGRVGVFQFGAFPMLWSNLKVRCLEEANRALYFNGVDTYVELDDLLTLGMDEGFTIEVWIKTNIYAWGPFPIFCSIDGDLCLWLEDRKIHARYGSIKTSVGTRLNVREYYNVVLLYNMVGHTLSIYIDGSRKRLVYNVPHVNWTHDTYNLTMWLGRQGDNYYQGPMDEFRLYNYTLPHAEVKAYTLLLTTDFQVRQHINLLYFRMEDTPPNATTLVNSGLLTSPKATLHGVQLNVQKSQQLSSTRHKQKYLNTKYIHHA